MIYTLANLKCLLWWRACTYTQLNVRIRFVYCVNGFHPVLPLQLIGYIQLCLCGKFTYYMPEVYKNPLVAIIEKIRIHYYAVLSGSWPSASYSHILNNLQEVCCRHGIVVCLSVVHHTEVLNQGYSAWHANARQPKTRQNIPLSNPIAHKNLKTYRQ